MTIAGDTRYTRTVFLKSIPGTKVEINKFLSGLNESILAAKKTAVYALMNKAGVLESTAEYRENFLIDSHNIALDHDLHKVLFGLKSWEVNEDCFWEEPDNMELSIETIGKLRNEVLAEINDLIDKVHKEFLITVSKTDVDSKKNVTPRLISSSGVASMTSNTTKRSSARSKTSSTKQP